jgi:YD repeat-containing protein
LGWTSNVEEKIYVGGDYLVKSLRGDGSIWSYGFRSYASNGNVQYLLAGPRNGNASAQLGLSSFTITLKSGEQKTFDPVTGHLLSSADRNGNTTLYSYNSSGQLVTVTDPAARHLYFTYSQQGQVSVVTSISSDVGLSVSYQYDNLARLTQVTAPDGTFVTFSYNLANLITTVLDMNGKTLEAHTYDSLGRGLTASRAGGVDAVSVSYSY